MNSYVNKFYHLTVTTVQSIHWNMQCGFSYLTVIIYSDKLTCCCKSGTCNSFWDLHAIRPCWDNLIVTCSMFLHEVCVHLPEVCEKTEIILKFGLISQRFCNPSQICNLFFFKTDIDAIKYMRSYKYNLM